MTAALASNEAPANIAIRIGARRFRGLAAGCNEGGIRTIVSATMRGSKCKIKKYNLNRRRLPYSDVAEEILSSLASIENAVPSLSNDNRIHCCQEAESLPNRNSAQLVCPGARFASPDATFAHAFC